MDYLMASMGITRELASHEIHEIGKASELKNDSFESGGGN